MAYYILYSSQTNTNQLDPSICLNICSLDQTAYDYCNNLWSHLDTPAFQFGTDLALPQTHFIIICILVGLCIFSIIEGIMDANVLCTPYRKLYEDTEGFISQSVPKRSNRRNQGNKFEMVPV